MSKAFTKEGDEGSALEELAPVESWPRGVKNYLTPAGHRALERAIEELRQAPRADAGRRRLLDQRLQALLERLEAAEVVDPALQPTDEVRFGATVTVEDEEGEQRRYRIVGVDEADPKRGAVSWRAPVARALLGRRVGDSATLRRPSGEELLTVTAIDYEHDG